MNELERENTSYFYIIEADRDGHRKYVNKTFPNIIYISILRKFYMRKDFIQKNEH